MSAESSNIVFIEIALRTAECYFSIKTQKEGIDHGINTDRRQSNLKIL